MKTDKPLNDLTLLTYTHSSCIDLHRPFIERIKKYFPELKNRIMCCNTNLEYEDTDCFVYDDADLFSNQLLNALNSIKTKYIIYSQEDCILFDRVNIDRINQYLEIMDSDNSISFIRLIWSGIDSKPEKYNDFLGYIEPKSKYFYSMQTTIWRKSELIDLYNNITVKSIFEEANISVKLRELNKKGLVTLEKGSKVGGHHNSLVYPYISTAIVKKKWNYSEYPKELDELFQEFKIDPKIRGFHIITFKNKIRSKISNILRKLKLVLYNFK